MNATEKDRLVPQAFWRRPSFLTFTTNERRVLSLLRRDGPLSRADISRSIDLSSQAIIKIVDALMNRGLVHMGEKVVSGPGQPSIPIHLSGRGAYTFGVSLQHDGFTLALIDLTGTILTTDTIACSISDRNTVIGILRSQMEVQKKAIGTDANRLFGVGFAASGFFVGRTGQLNAPKLLESWALTNLEQELSQAFDLPVWIENDGSAATAGENLYGFGRTHENFTYIYISQGLGGGVVSRGQLWRGANGNAGEFTGLLTPELRPDRPTVALLRDVLQAHRIDPDAALDSGFDLSHPAIDTWLDRVSPAFIQILSSIAAVHDPDLIVIGGELPPGINTRLADRAAFFQVPVRGLERPFPKVAASEMKGNAVALGAAAIPFLHHFF